MSGPNGSGAKFIVFEYVDGGDARPFITRTVNEFFAGGQGVVTHREPTNGVYANPLKTVLEEDWSQDNYWRELVHGFLADRFNHVKKKTSTGIETSLARGDTVICDRYNLSTYAYQLPSEAEFDWFYICSQGLLVPDLTVFLKYDIETCVDQAAEILPGNTNEYAILNRKARRDKGILREEIKHTQEMYLKAIRYLQKKMPTYKIHVLEVNDVPGAWYTLHPIIEECLKG